MTTAIYETSLAGLLHRGKVRDMYEIGDGLLLMVASDRISAFDVIMPNPVPDKGAILAQMSAFWFDLTRRVVPNHLVAMAHDELAMYDVARVGALLDLPRNLAVRSAVVKEAKRIDMECVVRGYITGSAWVEYRRYGTVNGTVLPLGLREADHLPEPIFTPSTKAAAGHDMPLTRQQGEDLVGGEMYSRLEDKSIEVYEAMHRHARTREMIIADTKMEFGMIDGELTLIDELGTPDSSRFWDTADWQPGSSPEAFDKQFLRDWLLESGWNREPPAPELPAEIVEKTRERYLQAFTRITGQTVIL